MTPEQATKLPKTKRGLFIDLAVATAIFFVLYFAIALPLFPDEFPYLWWSASPGHLLSSLRIEGKEPFPLWIARLFLHTIEFQVFSARLGSMIIASLGAFLLLRVARKKDIPIWFVCFALFSSSYFVYYSRVFMYEIYVIFCVFFLCFGASRLFTRPKLGATCIFFASFFGSISARAYLRGLQQSRSISFSRKNPSSLYPVF